MTYRTFLVTAILVAILLGYILYLRSKLEALTIEQELLVADASTKVVEEAIIEEKSSAKEEIVEIEENDNEKDE